MWYDLLTLVILMYAMFRGAMKGIVWQLATIAALLMCFFFSGSLSAAVAPFIRVEPPLNQWIAMFILYLGFSFVSFGVARALHEMIESMRIEALDRHLGAILGLVKGGMFSLFLTFFLVTLSHAARETIINSESGYVAAVVIDRLDPVIPGDLHTLLEPYIRRLDPMEIERQHREERLAREGRLHDDRDLDRRDLADDDRDDVDDRRLPSGVDRDRTVRDRSDRAPLDHDRLDHDRVNRDPVVGDRGNPDRPLQTDRRVRDDQRGLDDQRRPDVARDGDAALTRDRRPGGDDRQEIALDRDGDARPAVNRDRRSGDDPLFDANSNTDGPPRRYERRRTDDRPDLRPASDTKDDYAQATAEETNWLSSLPALTDELKQMALKAWRKTRPERRRELTHRLSSGSVPDLIRKTLQEWIDGPPATAGDVDGERGTLERAIARALVATRTDRPAAIEDMEAQLKGIPDEVSLNVLRDWRADLLDKSSDPDPSTTDRSSMNDRIVRQLKKSGISLRSLDAATRDRLLGSETR
jgi:uncharacterized membrane protein required for colicin V production